MERFIEIDRDYRKQVRKVYYMREEDFATMREYNDYLEEVEEIIELLINDETRAAARVRLDKLSKAAKAKSSQNHAKLDADQRAMKDAIIREKEEAEEKAEQRDRAAQAAAEAQRKQQIALIEDVAAGKQTAAHAQLELRRHQARIKQSVPEEYKPKVQVQLGAYISRTQARIRVCHPC